MNNKNNLTGACYIRVSTGKQEELSPDAQKRLILDYAIKHNILIPAENIFIENGISGRKAEKRPEFQRMVAIAKKKPKPFDIILLWKFSRFARNREDSIVYKSLLRKQCGIEVVSITEHIGDDKISMLIEALLEAMDEYYSINLAEEVIRGMTEKALRGGYQSAPPLGYKQPYSGGIPIIVESQAYVVRFIYEQFVTYNKEATTIARMCNTLGYRTSRGNLFEKRSIDYILKNPFYIGKVRWNLSNNTNSSESLNNSTILSEGEHSPIIEISMFQKAAQRFLNDISPPKRRSSSYSVHWLSGLLKCSLCGGAMIHIHNASRKSEGFQCCGYTKGKHSGSQYISASNVEEAVYDSIKEVMAASSKLYTYQHCNAVPSNSKTFLSLELDKINQKVSRAKSAYLNGVDTLEEYQTAKQQLVIQQNKLKEQMDVLVTSKTLTFEMDCCYPEKISTIYDLLISPSVTQELKSEAIRTFVEYMVVDKEQQLLRVYYY